MRVRLLKRALEAAFSVGAAPQSSWKTVRFRTRIRQHLHQMLFPSSEAEYAKSGPRTHLDHIFSGTKSPTNPHTHTHTLSSPRSRKGCLRKRGTRSRRCVHNNTQRHNNTDAESHSPNLIHRTEIRMSHAGCRGYIGRQEHPETQSNTRTYGTKKSSYVHAYIGRDGKWRKRVQT